nr:retron St85 family RNA-directed DNA polymerase [uncultured Anaeromusa sp.]
MWWSTYSEQFRDKAKKSGFQDAEIGILLDYARNIHENGYPIIFDVSHLSCYVGVKKEYIYKVVNAAPKFYRYFNIPKKSGGVRNIAEPLPLLKEIQYWILNNILISTKVHPCAKAFKFGCSIKDNARFHLKKNAILIVDIQGFFPGISFSKVKNVFIQMGYYEQLAIALANLCCLNSSLPQGAPTSPVLSNLIMYQFDCKMYEYAKENHLLYTRYADDISISGFSSISPLEVLNFLRKELKHEGFLLNSQKTRILKKYQRQVVTGIVVNEKIRVNRKYRQKIRQEMYYISKFGLESHVEYCGIMRKNYLEHLLGKINHVLFVNSKDKEMLAYRKQVKKWNVVLDD